MRTRSSPRGELRRADGALVKRQHVEIWPDPRDLRRPRRRPTSHSRLARAGAHGTRTRQHASAPALPLPKQATAAGCIVFESKPLRNSRAWVVHDRKRDLGRPNRPGQARFKDDIHETTTSRECGVQPKTSAPSMSTTSFSASRWSRDPGRPLDKRAAQASCLARLRGLRWDGSQAYGCSAQVSARRDLNERLVSLLDPVAPVLPARLRSRRSIASRRCTRLRNLST